MDEIKRKIMCGYEKLAFGEVSDPVRLLFQEKITAAGIRKMNLFNVAQIKKKDNEVDIKFFDRIKALQCMQEMETEQPKLKGFLEAVQKAAESVQDDEK